MFLSPSSFIPEGLCGSAVFFMFSVVDVFLFSFKSFSCLWLHLVLWDLCHKNENIVLTVSHLHVLPLLPHKFRRLLDLPLRKALERQAQSKVGMSLPGSDPARQVAARGRQLPSNCPAATQQLPAAAGWQLSGRYQNYCQAAVGEVTGELSYFTSYFTNTSQVAAGSCRAAAESSCQAALPSCRRGGR